MGKIWFMIQKILIIFLIFFILIYGLRLLKKIKSFNVNHNKTDSSEEDIIDLEKDPKTNQYKPKK